MADLADHIFDDLAVLFQASQVVAGFAIGAADAIETPGLAAHGVLEQARKDRSSPR